MALVVASSFSGTSEGPCGPGRSLEEAVDEFRDILTDAQRQRLSSISCIQDAQSVLIFIAQLDRENQLKRGRGVASRLVSVLQSVQAFSAVVDTYVSSKPNIAALVWGSIKLAMLIAMNYAFYFESLSSLFMTFGAFCPRFAEYQALFPASSELQKALCDFHAAIVRCCKHALEAIQRPWFKQLGKGFFQSFEQEFKPDISNIQMLSKEVTAAIDLAKTKADCDQHDLQQMERDFQTQHRSTMRIFKSKATEELETIRRLQLQQSERDSRLKRQQLLETLSSHDYLTPYREASKRRQRNTAEWILATPEFCGWYDGTAASLLWCSGKIGSGKTILCANVINYVLASMRHSCDHPAAFFFVQHDNSDSLKAEILIRSLIRQTFEDVNKLSDDVEDRLQSLHLRLFVPLKDWAKLLQRRIKSFSTFFIVIDGLDEYETAERRDVLNVLSSLLSPAGANPRLRIFISSRASVHFDLKDKFKDMQRVTMACHSQSSDISRYVEATIDERILNGELVCGDPELKDDIKTTLSQHADGMFLSAVFLICEVCLATCDDDIRQSLRSLPRDLQETFARALYRILRRGQDKMAQKVFFWLVVARRPLTLDVGEAVSIEVSQPHSMPGRRVHQMNRILLWCNNLVQVTEEVPQLIQFAHKTIRNFITQTHLPDQLAEFHIDSSEADHFADDHSPTNAPLNVDPVALTVSALGQTTKRAELTRRFAELTSTNLTTRAEPDIMAALANYGRVDAKESLKAFHLSHPFLNYAANHWIDHTARFQDGKTITWSLWHQIITSGHDLAQTPWQESTLDERELAILTWSHQARHYALLRHVIGTPGLSDAKYSLLKRSCDDGDAKIVDLFLEVVRHSEEWMCKALHAASKSGHLRVLKRLIDAGADVNRADQSHYTALYWASLRGRREVVERLLEAGADVNSADQTGHTAIIAAAANGHLQIVERLLDAGADVHSADQTGHTAIIAAAANGHLQIVERLLDAGADVHSADQTGHTAIIAAAANGHLRIVERLVNAGADTNSANSAGWTALTSAWYYGHTRVVRRLMDAGANVNSGSS